MTCPSCHRQVDAGLTECPGCGVVMAKWRPPTSRPQITRLPQAAPAPVVPPTKSSPARLLRVVVIGLGGAALLIGGYWFVKIRPRIRAIEDPYFGSAPTAARTLKIRADRGDFDARVELPGDPIGIAVNGSEFLIGNRTDPWGFQRLRRAGDDEFRSENVPVVEPTYSQRIQLRTVAWNGKNYIGYTDGSWFQSPHKYVFTVHDPQTLRVLGHHKAPEQLGCLAFDGQGYWAATRRNTMDSGEPVHLYRLNSNFAVVRKTSAPGVGCQGLAWDGKFLWFADVFSDQIHVLDVSSSEPRVVHSASTPFGYLSGLGYDGKNIWVAEYDKKGLHRLSAPARLAWSGVAPAATLASAVSAIPTVQVLPSSGVSEIELRRKLRSESWSDRMQAEMELKQRGLAVDYDRDQNSFAKRPADDAEVLDWSVELRNGRLYGSWKIFFGSELFNRPASPPEAVMSMPLFARYTVTVVQPGGAKIEREFEARPGENIEQNIDLAAARTSGEYEVSIFLHIQHVSPDGTNRILNRSGTSLGVRQ